jgi:hypothetical protein
MTAEELNITEYGVLLAGTGEGSTAMEDLSSAGASCEIDGQLSIDKVVTRNDAGDLFERKIGHGVSVGVTF